MTLDRWEWRHSGAMPSLPPSPTPPSDPARRRAAGGCLSDDGLLRARRAARTCGSPTRPGCGSGGRRLDLRYRPNLTARSFATKVTRTVALVSDTIAAGPYGGAMVRGALYRRWRRGHVLFLTETSGNPELEARLAEDLLARQVDGFVYASTATRATWPAPAALAGHPAVLLNCLTGDGALPAVLPDERAGRPGRGRVLLERGHRDGIVVLGETPPAVSTRPASGWPGSRRRWPRPAPRSPGRWGAPGGRSRHTRRSARARARAGAAGADLPQRPDRVGRVPGLRAAGLRIPDGSRSSRSTTPTWPAGSGRS